jgi:hypothetical protein
MLNCEIAMRDAETLIEQMLKGGQPSEAHLKRCLELLKQGLEEVTRPHIAWGTTGTSKGAPRRLTTCGTSWWPAPPRRGKGYWRTCWQSSKGRTPPDRANPGGRDGIQRT